MSACITLPLRIASARDFISKYFDPNNGNSTHFYTGRSIPWDDETSPDIANSSMYSIDSTLRQRIFHKKLSLDNVILAIKRFNWESGTIYTRADYNVDYTDYRTWIDPFSPFYVINSEGNVYKCISNNNNSPSTEEPLGQSLSYLYLGDGYIWKFMFDPKILSVINFSLIIGFLCHISTIKNHLFIKT